MFAAKVTHFPFHGASRKAITNFSEKNFLKILIIRKVRKTLYKLFRVLFQRFQPFPLEDQHIKDSNGDSGVGKIEYGSEKDEMSVRAEEKIG